MEMEKKGRDQRSNERGRRTEARLVYILQGCSRRHEMRQLRQRRCRLWQVKLCELDSVNDGGSQYIAHSKLYLLALGIKIIVGDDGDVQTSRKSFTERGSSNDFSNQCQCIPKSKMDEFVFSRPASVRSINAMQ